MKKFLASICGLTSILLLPLIASAQVTKIVFTTEPQTIKPSIISEALTFQTQDSAGNMTQTTETLDLVFTSTSQTGEFLNSAGNPVSKTMSVNTANRTFYYRDSNQGAFTLTVTATGRVSGEVLVASQQITVSQDGTSGSGEVLAANTENTQSTQSATSGSATPSYATPASQLEVLAGGDRVTTPGSPISFQAVIKKNSSANSSVGFSWSYGDGNVGSGALVTHMYKYPGEYAVVLNAKSGNNFAVSRLRVRVASPDLALTDFGDRIEIANNSNIEINLFNWKIINQDKAFIFQPDTIILPKSKILIDKSMLSMKGERVNGLAIKNFLGQTVVESLPQITAADQKILSAQLAEMQKEANVLMGRLKPATKISVTNQKPQNQGGEVAGESVEYQEMLKTGTTTEPLGEVIYESPVKKNAFGQLLDLLKKIFD